jgi:hypothetical protein
MAEINRKANGSDAVELSRGASAINMIPARRPKIKKLSIIREFKIL